MTKTEGRKNDQGKAPMSLIPKPALEELAKVLDFGRQKYDAHNWRKGMKWSRVADAAMRHLTSWYDGEDKDKESGLSHLGHCLCCLAFLATYQQEQLGEDDRYRKSDGTVSS